MIRPSTRTTGRRFHINQPENENENENAVCCRFKSQRQEQRFLDVYAAVYNPFNLGRHLTAARYYQKLRQRAFASWAQAVAA
jgi:putative transposase